MANASEGGTGGGKPNRLPSSDMLAAAFAADLDRLTKRFVGGAYATVTDADFRDSDGFVTGTIGYTEVRILCNAGDPISEGSVIRVRRFIAGENTVWEYSGGGGSVGTSGPTEVSFTVGAPGTPVGPDLSMWGVVKVPSDGTVTGIETTPNPADATVGIAVYVNDGLDALTVGSSVAAGDDLYFYLQVGDGTAETVSINITIT